MEIIFIVGFLLLTQVVGIYTVFKEIFIALKGKEKAEKPSVVLKELKSYEYFYPMRSKE